MTVVELLALLTKQGITLSAEGSELRISAPKGALTDALRSQLVTHKRELLELLSRTGQARNPIARMPQQFRDGDLPLSSAQERLWFLYQLEPRSPVYNIPSALRLRGPLMVNALQGALRELTLRHEILRMNFADRRGEVRAGIRPDPITSLQPLDIAGKDPTAVAELLTQLNNQPFDLTNDPLLRAYLLRGGQDDHILLLVMHHIIADGWSLGILMRELATLYAAAVSGRAPGLPALPVQYADYAIWQRQMLDSGSLETHLHYWRSTLAGAPPTIDIPGDYPRPAKPSGNGAWSRTLLDEQLLQAVETLARQQRTTAFSVLLASFALLLHRYSRLDDLVIGIPVAGRQLSETESLIGLFVNSVPIRSTLNGDPGFLEFLASTSAVSLDAMAHQDLPFEKLVEDLQPARVASQSPIFQVMFNLQNREQELAEFAGLETLPVVVETRTAKFDLNVLMETRTDGLAAWFEYNTDLFAAETIDRMLQHYGRLLAAITAAPTQPISTYCLLDNAERNQVIDGWNDTATTFPADATLVSLFEAQVEQTPVATALEYDDINLNYAELNQRANQLAHYLRAAGAGPETRIGVYMERSVEMVLALYGILKAGGAYVPLDPDYPPQRLAQMIQDADIRLIISTAALASQLPPTDTRTIALDDATETARIATFPTANPRLAAQPDNAAYVIFTSGSTGQPKGALNEHRGICNRLLWMQAQYRLDNTDRVLQKTPFSFDVSVWEFFWPLITGARLVLAAPGGHRDTRYLAGLIRDKAITTLHFVPSMLAAFLQEPDLASCNSIRRAICSGEALTMDLQRRFFATFDAELHNLYGPTEAAIDVTYWQCRRDDRGSTVPIGRPVANTRIYIVDPNGQPTPIGVPGELWIGGIQVARGYLNRPELTAERFIPDPFAPAAGQRIYRTGDLARYRPDGVIEFLGRIDFQVKLRGFRIELGEIETALESIPGITQAAVLLREDSPGDQRLAAYLTTDSNFESDMDALRGALTARLPDYMVPSAFVLLEKFPITLNGKLDRRALPAPTWAAADEYVAPRNALEESLCAIFALILGVERVGIHDDFFALGGHSLLAMKLVSRIRDELGLEMPLAAIFERSTVSAIATLQDGATATLTQAIRPCDRDKPLPLSFAQQRLWFLDQLEPGASVYNIPWAMELEGTLKLPALQAAVDRLVSRHESLRTNFAKSTASPAQIIHATAAVPIQVLELPKATRTRLQERLLELAQTPFDLRNDALLRVHLLRSDEVQLLLIVVHHIVADRWSMGLLATELAALYTAECAGTQAVLPDLPIQYADYAVWQRDWLAGPEMERQLGYWRDRLHGAPDVLPLPTDHARPAIQTYRGATVTRLLSQATGAALKELAAAESSTLFMLLLAAFNVLLQRYCDEDDIVIGTPVAGRNRSELENLFGFFLNTLAIRTAVSADSDFRTLLKQVRNSTTAAFAHQDVPFEKLVEELKPTRDTSRSPIFQVLFVIQQDLDEFTALNDVRVSHVPLELASAKFDLSLFVAGTPAGLTTAIEYNTDLFDATTIERMLDHFAALLNGILANPDAKLADLVLMGTRERQQVLDRFNDSTMVVENASVTALIERQSRATPEAAAVVMRNQTLSYAELNARANRLAHQLMSLGAEPGQLVGISCERSPEMAVAVLAVLKSGAAYVPIDPNYPVERTRYMLDDCKPAILLTQRTLLPQLPEFARPVVCLDEFDFGSGDASNPEIAGESIYAIYTSGSTGQPKGVELTNGGLSNLVQWQNAQPGLNTPARTLQFASLSFDVSFQELFTTWAQGGTLVLIDEELRRDLPELAKFIATERIERVYLPYAALQPLAEIIAASRLTCGIRDVIVAGEQLQITPSIRRMFRALGNARLHNQYGPSETHVVTSFTLSGNPDTWAPLPPIGRPVGNMRVYVLDTRREPAPIGIPGELYISGVQVAKAYLHRPEQTAEKFLSDPFAAGQRMYRTGDRVRFLHDGNLEYLGRMDEQVKWRGFRIEPGEIEARLTEHPAISQAAVVLREDSPGDKRLVAYLVSAADQTPDAIGIRTWLKSKVPDYMLPSAFVMLERLPLTPSGKVARRLLPAPDFAAPAETSVAPRTPVEETLAAIWAEVLKRPQVGIFDDFFELGGHSLLATQLISRVRDALGVELPLITVFNHPSIAAFAAAMAQTEGHAPSAPLAPCDRSRPLLLSFAQQRLWFLDQLEPGSHVYNIPWLIRLDGRPDDTALQQAVDALLTRHESLRTRFADDGNAPVQIIDAQCNVAVQRIELPNNDVATWQHRVEQLAQVPFDLTRGPLIRVHVLCNQTDSLLLVVMHHIVSDGWSLGILANELAELYASALSGGPPQLQPLPVQYADFAIWQRDRLTGIELDRQLDYWRQELGDAPALLQLPTDRPRPAVQSFRGAYRSHSFRAELGRKLKHMAGAEDSTLFMLLLAAFNVLLHRYSAATDIVLGTPIAGRTQSETEGLIGLFMNTLALRTNLSGNPGFLTLLQRVRATTLQSYAHQDLPFEKLVEELQPERDTSRSPIFQVLFAVQQDLPELRTFGDLGVQHVQLTLASAKFDLSLYVTDLPDQLTAGIEYNTDLFDAATIERMLRHFENLLEGIVAQPDAALSDLPLLGPDEAQQLLIDWNNTATDYDRDATLHGLFEHSVIEHTQRTALISGNLRISYGALEQRANQLAHYLVSLGAGRDVPIGVCMGRTDDTLVALLAILKSGSAYLPLDPNFPSDRLRYMLEDSAAPILVCEAQFASLANNLAVTVVHIDRMEPGNAVWPATPPCISFDATQLAYIIYTSGSTGKPKGVAIPHRAAVNFLLSMMQQPGIKSDDRWLAVTTLSFDISVLELFGPLAAGAAVVLADSATAADGFALARALAEQRITIMQATPATWRLLLQSGWHCDGELKILCGGEALDPQLARELVAAGNPVWNMYGPTETTVWSACERVATATTPITVGRPIANTRCYILDPHGHLVPAGVAGELHIGGDGVARGYLNRPELTSEKFVTDPFAGIPGARMYRTGDLARHRADGRLEILGRIDQQVKLRGYRIEPGEIESSLRAQPGIEHAVVIVREDTPGDQRLVAYITASDGQPPGTDSLRARLQADLPDYMVPAIFVTLDALPLTPNGKIDRKALPAPEWSAPTVYQAPRNAVESELCGLWAGILGLERAGIHDDFFALGGHSLLAMKLAASIRRALQIDLPLIAIFDNPTVAQLATLCSQADVTPVTAITRCDRSKPIPLSFAQQRLWFLQAMETSNATYNLPWALRMDGAPDVSALQQALNELVARHELLRTRFAGEASDPVQVADDNARITIERLPLRGASESDMQARLNELAHKPFDLAAYPLLRLHLLETDDYSVLLIVVHHIIADGWSLDILLAELGALYAAACAGTEAGLQELSLQYADYAVWQRDWLAGDALPVQLAYWRERLNGAPALLNLPTDHARPAIQSFKGATAGRTLSASLSRALQRLATGTDSTLFMVLLTAFNLLLQRYSRDDDIVVGTPIAGRSRSEFEGLIGLFVNTLAVRTDLSGNPRFSDLLAKVRTQIMRDYMHQDLPFEKLVEELQPARNTSHSPLFQVLFSLQQSFVETPVSFGRLDVQRLTVPVVTSKFDLSMLVTEFTEDLSVFIEYNTDLFDRGTIERMLTHFEALLTAIARDPQEHVARLPLLDAAARSAMLTHWRPPHEDFSDQRGIHELFEIQAARNPDAIAVSFGGQHFTYAEINTQANRLAHRLLSHGAGPDMLIGLCVERSAELVTGILGILKSGGAYLPLDPHYPADRLAFMIEDSQTPIVVTQPDICASLPAHSALTVTIDDCMLSDEAGNPGVAIKPGNLAYVIYTSGSTGKPKGVLIEHGNVTRLLHATDQWFSFGNQDVWTLFHSYAFDFSVWELWGALAYGGRLVVVPYFTSRSPEEFHALLAAEGVTVLNQTPSAFAELIRIDSAYGGTDSLKLRYVIFGGEALDIQSLRPWFERHGDSTPQLINMYGITETTVHVTYRLLTVRDCAQSRSTIGQPIPDLQLYILDAELEPLPDGVPGEIFVGGAGLARGYLNRPELTAERFIRDPFSNDPAARLYRSGDLARSLPGGDLEYLGRIDQQVKIRGFRIELGEIENALRAEETIDQAVVIVREDTPGDQRLAAYVTAARGTSIDSDELRRALARRLPDYMVPAVFVALESIPLTANGKVDRKALPAPTWSSERAYVPPRNRIEESLCDLFARILGVERVGIHDDFFALGGHSLLVMKLVAGIRGELQLDLPLAAVFNNPTVAEISLRCASAAAITEGAIPRCDRDQPIPLSFAQQRMWFIDQLNPGNTVYNSAWPIRLEGELRVDLLQDALDEVVRRQDILRTNYVAVVGRPQQVINPNGRIEIQIEDLPGASEDQLQQRISDLSHVPFDLSSEPLLRVYLLRYRNDAQVLLLVIHHINTDGWSNAQLLRELGAAYSSRVHGQSGSLPLLPIQYADYAVWQRNWMQGEQRQAQLTYWTQQLAGAPDLLALPTDRPRPAVQTYAGGFESRLLSNRLIDDLQKLARDSNTTLFMILLAAFNVLLQRYSREEDIVIGTPIAGRRHPGIQDLLGVFINMLPLRVDVSGDPGFLDLLAQVRNVALDAYSNEDLPFEMLIEELQPDRNLSHAPIFQILFDVQTPGKERDLFAGLYQSAMDTPLADAKVDITFTASLLSEGCKARIDYNADLFAAPTIQRMLAGFEVLLSDIVADPTRRISRYRLLDEDQRQQLLSGWNDTARAVPAEATLISLFEEQVKRTPHATALVYDDSNLSYAELNQRANQLARYLLQAGVGSETRVGVYMERSLEMVIALYGILKSGAAYVPLDPDYPAQRIAHMVEDADIRLILTQSRLSDQLPATAAQAIPLDTNTDSIVACADTNLPLAAHADNAAYVIFTSGSTGQPKGALNEHRGICNRILWMQAEYDLDGTDCVLQKTPFSFDVSVWEFFWPLMAGARLLIAAPGGHRDARYLARLIREQAVTTLHFVPSMLAVFLQEPEVTTCRSIRRVICSGEALTTDLQGRFFATLDAELHNLYGPTEAAIDVTYWQCRREDQGSTVPIGRPVANTQVYIVDQAGQPTPIGVPGELWIGGVQVARGYLNRPELTAERFIPNPFLRSPGQRIYRTGDLARYRPDGVIEFLGRIDFQVKLRGFRIELGEVEAALLQNPAVREAIVTLWGTNPDDRKLVGYIVATPEIEVDVTEVRRQLAGLLPDYMVPAAIMRLEKLPLNANGKVDRKALPDPEWERTADKPLTAPRTPLEEILLDLWRQVLGQEDIGIDDDFFDLGGHSLLTTQLAARISETLNVKVDIRTLFEARSVAEFALELESGKSAGSDKPITPVARSGNLPLSFAQQRLWFLDKLDPENPVYNIPWAIGLRGPLQVAALQNALDLLVQRHEVLRTSFPATDGYPRQEIAPASAVPLKQLDLSGFADSAIQQQLATLAGQAFNLSEGPLFRAYLLHIKDNDHILMLVMHHAVSDGWSVNIMFRELITAYRESCLDQRSALPDLSIQYADYAVWQRHWLSGTELDRQLDYWKLKLAGAPARLELPTDKPRPAVQTSHGAAANRILGPQLHGALKALGRDNGCTLYMVLLAIFKVLLYRYSGQDDIVIGTPIAGRRRRELEGLVGFFINTLVLRSDASGQPSFTDFLRRIRQTALDAYSNQELPFERLVDELQPVRDMSHTPLFQVMFILQNAPWGSETFEGLEARPVDIETGTAKFDLTLSISETRDGLRAYFEYNTDLYEHATIERMLDHFEVLAKSVIDDPLQQISHLQMLTGMEQQQILVDWNATRDPYPGSSSLPALFEAQVEQSPGALALLFRNEQYTYAALNERANKLAHFLSSRGVRRGDVVALSLERSSEVIIGILGILKSGAAYVPLDPAYPQDRLAFMLQDSGASVLLSQHSLVQKLPPHRGVTIFFDTDRADIESCQAINPATCPDPDDLAYIIYTSGSTGRPKGVMVGHRSICNLIHAQRCAFGLGANDRVLQFASISFDASIYEIVKAFGAGATLCVASTDETMPGLPLLELLQQKRITTVTLPPSALQQLPLVDLPQLSTITVAGEACPVELVDKWQPGRRFFNLYGPTEFTVWATYKECRPGEPVTIGKPVRNAQVYILDANLQALPVGVPGELCLGGASLSLGYLNRKELTADRFVRNPFGTAPDEKIYRTGDRAQFAANGEIRFLGRIDHQVKVRGFRIELGEIESALASHPAVKECLVIANGKGLEDQQLVAYLIPADTRPTLAELREHLQHLLPDFMVPAAFVTLDEWPLTPNGKIDRAALPAAERARLRVATEFAPPRNRDEEILADIWTTLLGVERVGIHDNFFELGGDSILSIQIIARANERGVTLTPRQLFQNQTIAELAAAANTGTRLVVADQERITGSVPLTPIQHWFFEKNFAARQHFNQSILLASNEALDAGLLEQSLRLLTEHHDSLRLRFRRSDAGWQQEIAQTEDGDLLVIVQSTDVRQLDQVQAALDIGSGPLLKAALLEHGHKLLLVVHHLAVDWVSWSALLADLEFAYTQLQRGKPVTFTRKTSSFKLWAERLVAWTASPGAQSDIDFWLNQPWDGIRQLTADKQGGSNTEKSNRVNTLVLDAEKTSEIIHGLTSRYKVSPRDVLLTATAIAVGRRCGSRDVLIELEGHGREDIFDDIDTSRTVGWFTTLYPLLVRLPAELSAENALPAIRDQLIAIPHNGLTYGVLRYLDNNSGLAGRIPAANISFNFLGNIDQVATSGSMLRVLNDARGMEHGGANERPHLIDINSMVTGGRLYINLGYSSNLFADATITALANDIAAELDKLIAIGNRGDARHHAPQDFPLAGISQHELDTLTADARDIEDIYPLTALQQGMLFHSLLEQSGDVYFASYNWLLEGNIDPENIHAAWNLVANLHSSSRSAIRWLGLSKPVQLVYRNVEVPFSVEDWRGIPALEQDARMKERFEADRSKRFDLATAPLMRVSLMRCSENQYRMLWSFHHMIMDGWSVPLIIRQVFAVYDALEQGHAPNLLPTRPFSDYIRWLQKQDQTAARNYWKKVLQGFSAPTPLPGASLVDASQDLKPDYQEIHFSLPVNASIALRNFAKQNRLTVNSITQGAWALLLSRYSGEPDVLFGATTAGRPATLQGIESMVGLFLNTLPVRIAVDKDMNLLDWLQQVQDQQLTIQQYEYASLVEIHGWSDVPRSLPLFETLLAFENYPDIATMGRNDGNIKVKDSRGFDRTNFPLTLNIAMMDTLHLRFIYDRNIWSPAKMQRLGEHLQCLFRGFPANAGRTLGDIPMLGDEESQLLERWNATARDYPQHATLADLIRQQAARTPAATALSYLGETLSFAELEIRSNQLAHYLRLQGVTSQTAVGVCMERSIELVLSLVAIIKAGGAYVPMDPDYPADRLQGMAEDAGLAVLICQRDIQQTLAGITTPRIVIDDVDNLIANLPVAAPAVDIKPDHLAYIIFTSGSTGRPKGVMNEHRGIVNRLLWMQDEYQLDPTDKVLQKTPFSFDVSVWEFFWPLISGAELVIAKPGGHRDSAYLADLVRSRQITTLHFVPSMLQVFLQDAASAGCTSLKRVICSGEALSYDLQRRFYTQFDTAELHNLYGPTEAAIDVTYWHCPRDSRERIVPIGRPVANTRLYITDNAGKAAAIGIAGELWISGVQVARGYANQPGLTAERFIADPFYPGNRVYRTGDLARYREDGAIEFLGRIDHQIKLRGFRIELGEIEAALELQPNVNQSVVLLREDTPGLPELVAYVNCTEPARFDKVESLEILATKLPDYMIPSSFVVLGSFPVTANGKVDRKALPAPESRKSTVEFVAPRTATEERLAAMWSELLGVTKIGLNDDFFALGGHSLTAMQMVSRVNVSMNIQLALESVFAFPRLQDLADAVDHTMKSAATAGQPIPIQRSSRRKRHPR